jgi:hypothetical protein
MLPYKPTLRLKLPYKMYLPDDILQIIKEYAKPVTRPDWRYLHKMTDEELYRRLLPFTIVRIKTDNCVIHLMVIKRFTIKLHVYKKLKMDLEIIH